MSHRLAPTVAFTALGAAIVALSLLPALSSANNALPCPRPRVPLPKTEPTLTPSDRTELVSGLYVQGGALILSCPQPQPPRGPYAGTLTVTSAHSGRVVARETLHRSGRLFRLLIAPGRYRLSATEGEGLRTSPVTVTLPQDHIVRQDIFVDVP